MPERFEPKGDYERIEFQSGYGGAEEQTIHNSTRLLRIVQDSLAEGRITVQEWHDQTARIIAHQHVGALARGLGIGPSAITDEHTARLQPVLNNQLSHLARWRDQMIDAPDGEISQTDLSRIDQYGTATAISLRLGETIPWPLPAMPGEGSICRINCKCNWDIDVLDSAAGDANAYWRLGVAEHCDTCEARAVEWNPFRIRNGVAA